jgi:hypothetical protein
MSPEICAAERYSLYSDIWSLGCLLYELCAKEPPFNARTHIELFQKIKAGRVSPIPPVYSAELQKVINSCLQVNPNARPDTSQLLNLPVVKLMRKEQEIVLLGRQLLKDKELAEKKMKEAEERMKTMESTLRPEIESSVRREWEVKARLEIDRHVAMEVERLEKIFEAEVLKRLEQQAAAAQPRSLTPSTDFSETQEEPSAPTSLETNNAYSSDLPSGTDLSSLSIESPPTFSKPIKRTTRTPFTRAHTFATNAVAVASPKDIQMVDPSPMSIASLSLSPRKNGQAQQLPKGNIFAAAQERWQPTNASSFNTPEGSDVEDSLGADDEDEEDDLPVLPSPTRDPFKQMNKRPGMARQKTVPANTKRLASAPNLFANANGANVKRPASAVPVVATSPARRGGTSPTRPRSAVGPIGVMTSKVPVAGDSGSPVRKTGGALKDANNKGNSNGNIKGEGLLKAALSRNQLQGRTLVELQQARAGGIPEREKPISKSDGAIKVAVRMTESEPPVWDPERDEMPSPFLVRTARPGLRSR